MFWQHNNNTKSKKTAATFPGTTSIISTDSLAEGKYRLIDFDKLIITLSLVFGAHFEFMN